MSRRFSSVLAWSAVIALIACEGTNVLNPQPEDPSNNGPFGGGDLGLGEDDDGSGSFDPIDDPGFSGDPSQGPPPASGGSSGGFGGTTGSGGDASGVGGSAGGLPTSGADAGAAFDGGGSLDLDAGGSSDSGTIDDDAGDSEAPGDAGTIGADAADAGGPDDTGSSDGGTG